MTFRQKTFTASGLHRDLQAQVYWWVVRATTGRDRGEALHAIRGLVQFARDVLGSESADALAAQAAQQVADARVGMAGVALSGGRS